MPVKINVINKSKKKVPINFTVKISELFFDYITELGIVSKNDSYIVSIVYVDKDEILAYNQKYRNKSISTDVLSFCTYEWKTLVPLEFLSKEEVEDLGDLLISIDDVTSNSISHNIDQQEELARVVVHGILHLFGFDHEGEMNKREEIYQIQEEFLDIIKKRERMT